MSEISEERLRVSDSLGIIKAMNRKDSLFPEEIQSLITSLQNQNPEIVDRAASLLQSYLGKPLFKLLSTLDHERVTLFYRHVLAESGGERWA